MHTVEELLGDTSATQVTHQVMKNCDVRDPRLDLSSLQSSRVSSHAVCHKTASEEALGHTCSYVCATVASLSVCSLTLLHCTYICATSRLCVFSLQVLSQCSHSLLQCGLHRDAAEVIAQHANILRSVLSLSDPGVGLGPFWVWDLISLGF